jgi:hypothetical protein
MNSATVTGPAVNSVPATMSTSADDTSPTCMESIRVWIGAFGLDWFGLVWFGLDWIGLDWFGLVWFGVVWCGVVAAPIPAQRMQPRANQHHAPPSIAAS